MREPKYRAWHKPTKKMFEVYAFTPMFIYEKSIDRIHTSPTLPANREDCVLMQFTGLTDKNGKEIFEGDFITMNLGEIERGDGQIEPNIQISKVTFNNGCFQDDDMVPLNIWNDCDIIGNQFEDTELLNQ